MAHCVDSFWAPAATRSARWPPVRPSGSWPRRCRRSAATASDLGAREDLLYGAYLAGTAFAATGSGLHHKICHVLGGRYGLPHAQTHAIMLPYVLAFNAPGAPDAARRIGLALGSGDPAGALGDPAGGTAGARRRARPAPAGCGEIGLREDQVAEAAQLIEPVVPVDNPVPADAAALGALLRHAWAGDPACSRGAPPRSARSRRARSRRARSRRAGSRRQGPGGQGPGWYWPRRHGPGGCHEAAREEAVTAEVLASFGGAEAARYREIMESLVRHLHAFAREVRLTETEWQQGIDFLTRAGHITDDRRQEFILLSDVLGLSMLTVAINAPASAGATEATVVGPFFVAGAPEVPLGGDIAGGAKGRPCYVSGTVRGTGGEPVPGARIEVWESDEDGFYDVQYSRRPDRGTRLAAQRPGRRVPLLVGAPGSLPDS